MDAATDKTWTLPGETWLVVPEFRDYYEGSDFGRVRSMPRTVDTKRGTRPVVGRVLSQYQDTYGYYVVSLYLDGARWTPRVHRVIAETFHGPCPEGMEVLHGPGGFHDNRPSNLSWGTRQANMLDKRRDGTHHMAAHEVCPRDHLLVEPNLVVSLLKRGFRSCLACDRGRSTVDNARKRHGITLDLRFEADRHYWKIVSGDPRLAMQIEARAASH